jgi:Tfp pilus assembly ATPase PilU
MTDKIINFYDKLGLIKNSNLPKTWKKHHIYNNSMILCLGGTGSGKSNSSSKLYFYDHPENFIKLLFVLSQQQMNHYTRC